MLVYNEWGHARQLTVHNASKDQLKVMVQEKESMINKMHRDAIQKEALIKFILEREEINWFKMIADRLMKCSHDNVWATRDEILCRTEDAANALADMIEALYVSCGDNVLVRTGQYDPEEDKRNGEEDEYTGWWYVTVD